MTEQSRIAGPCGVAYSTPGECGWCGWPKADHEQVGSLVHTCPVCGDRYHDPSWGDLDDHWQQHLAATTERAERAEAALLDIYESEPKPGSWDGWRESTRLRNIAQSALAKSDGTGAREP